MYVCYKIKNKQKEWHPATKPIIVKKERKKKFVPDWSAISVSS
jgi:hypothetical protein